MPHYTAIIDHEEGSAYGLSFPELPGCFAAADTLTELYDKSAEALTLYFADTVVHEPRPMDEIALLPEVLAALAQGGKLIALPYGELG